MTAVRLPPPRVVASAPAVERLPRVEVRPLSTVTLQEGVQGARGHVAHPVPENPPVSAQVTAQVTTTNDTAGTLFRHEALKAYQQGGALSAPLRIVPLTSVILLCTLAAALAVALAVACLGRVELTSRGRGVLRSREGVQPLIFETGGVVSDVLVREGDVVRAGQPLLRLDSTRLRTALLEAEQELHAVLHRTQRDDEEAKKTYARDTELLTRRAGLTRKRIRSQSASLEDLVLQRERYDNLAREGLVASQVSRERGQLLSQEQRSYLVLNDELARIEQALAGLEQGYRAGVHEREQQVHQATTRRNSARILLEQTELHASRDGRVESVLISTGEVIQPGTAVARLVPLTRSHSVVAFVPERDRAFVATGMEVRLELDQLPVGEFGSAAARIVRVSSEIASQAEIERALGAAAPLGVHFGVELLLSDDPKSVRLTQRVGSGTLVTVRMPLRKRRVVALLFDPIRKWLD